MSGEIAAVREVFTGRTSDAPGAAVHRVTVLATALAIVLANLVGAVVVTTLLVVAFPTPDEIDVSRTTNVIAVCAYVVVAVLFGLVIGLRTARPVAAWLSEDRSPTDKERRHTLALPRRLFLLQVLFWLMAALVFAGLNAGTSWLLAIQVFATVVLGGITTGALVYLIVGRLGSATLARALAGEPPQRYRVAGVTLRSLMTWGLATAGPVAGTLVMAAVSLGIDDVDKNALARAVVALCGVALLFGFVGTLLVARSISVPLGRLREGMRSVESGDLDVHVPVTDGTEVGFVQSGFNRMVDGLRERERVRDLFGRHVGHDVAHRALEEGITLGGEEREAAALFVDIVGSTGIAIERSPTDVVQMLNAFFAVVVAEVTRHGGFVNKFEGDGALAVFGAPLPQDDPSGCALAAARSIQSRLAADVPEVQVGIGVSSGNVVAGNVGAEDRFEYTVIGDPVNEAARLTELAKDRPERILASEVALSRARDDERGHWRLDGEVELRGRGQPTRVAVPL